MRIVWLTVCTSLLWGQIQAQGVENAGSVIGSDNSSLLQRCYDRWGCLSIQEPFFSPLRPLSLFPFHPEALEVQFLLVTRSGPDVFQMLKPRHNSSFAASYYNPQRLNKFIIHGYKEDGYEDWIKDLSRELLTAGDYNVISVDWHLGADQSYPQSVANTRSLALVIVDFIDFIQQRFRVSPTDIHLIGHNLGAHAAGYAGQQIRRLARITGLNPASPYFEHTDPVVRLDSNDAIFVDIIHTDDTTISSVPGMLSPTGHLDFYPTPGWRRVECPVRIQNNEDPKTLRRCKVVSAPKLFIESVNMDCPFYGYSCNSYANFSSGLCEEGCGTDMSKCASMGFKADEWMRWYSSYRPVTLFLEIGNEEPFCRYHYHISAQISPFRDTGTGRNETGQLFVKLTGTKGRTPLNRAVPTRVYFASGTNLDFVVSAPNLGRLLRLDAIWSTRSIIRTWQTSSEPPVIYIHSFKVVNLETSYREVFCGNGTPFIPDNIKTFFTGGSC